MYGYIYMFSFGLSPVAAGVFRDMQILYKFTCVCWVRFCSDVTCRATVPPPHIHNFILLKNWKENIYMYVKLGDSHDSICMYLNVPVCPPSLGPYTRFCLDYKFH